MARGRSGGDAAVHEGNLRVAARGRGRRRTTAHAGEQLSVCPDPAPPRNGSSAPSAPSARRRKDSPWTGWPAARQRELLVISRSREVATRRRHAGAHALDGPLALPGRPHGNGAGQRTCPHQERAQEGRLAKRELCPLRSSGATTLGSRLQLDFPRNLVARAPRCGQRSGQDSRAPALPWGEACGRPQPVSKYPLGAGGMRVPAGVSGFAGGGSRKMSPP